ncbi:MAG: BAX inhibitor (BI)-1/YccA family protein [Deltaproteobacteria bacterium]|nr:MAG: BAX inhibitor (BI)-1/YccA family protein [Deltaproteobacteria bacterium]
MEQRTLARPRSEIVVNEFVRSVYNWMAGGLALTGFMAFYVSKDVNMLRAIASPLVQIILFVAIIGLVFSISGMINRMSAATATCLFVIYSALMGVFLAPIFIIYTHASIASTFFICAGTFVGCSIYGWTTRRDLTSLGGFMMMGLIGIIIASVVNIFIRSSGLYYMISYIGVVVFVGLTAYDTQKLKNMALTQPAGLDGAVMRKGAILGALALYLDFINLFLMLLRIFGQGRD